MSRRILLVEDDRVLRSSLFEALSVEGYELKTAASLADARAQLKHAAPGEAIDLIVLDLGVPDGDGQSLVTELGHEVVATATTRSQAVEAFRDHVPGLVLADIQLADASSGIDAVEEILAIGDVPVVFITAYPERLLTGERPEPTYLVTKPFREETVRTAISQALFFSTAQQH